MINFLLILLALAAAFGTFPNTVKFLSISPETIFREWWFFLLLGYLAFFSAWYAIQRMGRLFKSLQDKVLPLARQIERTEPSEGFAVPFPFTPNHERIVAKVISDQRYGVKVEKSESACSILACKNSWAVWGAPLIHLGFAAVLIGGLITYLFSDVRDVMIAEGETITLPNSRVKMKLEKFSVLLHSGQAKPENYVSHFLIERNGKEVVRKDLQVNHPVRIGSTKIFQMRYRVDVRGLELVVYQKGNVVERLALAPKEKKRLARFPLLVQAEEVIPDFVISREGKISSQTPYFKNPAALVSLYSADNPNLVNDSVWAFQDLVSHEGRQAEELAFAIEKIKKRYVSGIKMSSDPGVPFAYVGYLLLIMGAFVSAFVIHRRFVITFKPRMDISETQVEIFGLRSKDAFALKRDLDVIKKKISEIFEVERA